MSVLTALRPDGAFPAQETFPFIRLKPKDSLRSGLSRRRILFPLYGREKMKLSQVSVNVFPGRRRNPLRENSRKVGSVSRTGAQSRTGTVFCTMANPLVSGRKKNQRCKKYVFSLKIRNRCRIVKKRRIERFFLPGRKEYRMLQELQHYRLLHPLRSGQTLQTKICFPDEALNLPCVKSPNLWTISNPCPST
jgi:hypothetical protein